MRFLTFRRIWLHIGVLLIVTGCSDSLDNSMAAEEIATLELTDDIWGTLANPGFDGHAINSTLFFSGNSRNGYFTHQCHAAINTSLYTVNPTDNRHLDWGVSSTERDFAVNKMIEAGVNVINMSYWGEEFLSNNCEDSRWVKYAPMQTSVPSNRELFDASVGKDILISPYIEDNSDWVLANEFPGNNGEPAFGLTAQIAEIINTYLVNPANPAWKDKWAKAYNKDGEPRYIISLIHVASNTLNLNDPEIAKKFVDGFDAVALKILQDYNILIGFNLDMLPSGDIPSLNTNYNYRPDPTVQKVRDAFLDSPSVLAIQCFIPEIWIYNSSLTEVQLIDWKRDFSEAWIDSGVPFLQDVTPGYDNHIVFPNSFVQYGNTGYWRDQQNQLIQRVTPNGLTSKGTTFNAWNGYTEGFAGMPTVEYSTYVFDWAKEVFSFKAE